MATRVTRGALQLQKKVALFLSTPKKKKPTPNSEAQANLIIFQCYK